MSRFSPEAKWPRSSLLIGSKGGLVESLDTTSFEIHDPLIALPTCPIKPTFGLEWNDIGNSMAFERKVKKQARSKGDSGAKSAQKQT